MNLAVYQALDDETLVALANKGLLRRAQKDLEASPPEMQEERADALVLSFSADGCAVTMPAAGPAKATCTCPAGRGCRHILTAALYLRAQAQQETASAPTEADSASVEAAPPPDELMQLSEADLIAWASRTIYRQAVDELAFGELEINIEAEGKATRFHFPQYNVVVRWLASAGLEGMISSCKCPGRPVCRHSIAAILVYQAQHGKPLPASEKRTLEASAGTPRSREEVLESVQKTLAEMIALGLGRLSKTTEGRLTTLAISAHGVDLPNLEYALRGLSDHLSWQLSRDVRASTEQLLVAAARVYALAFALAHAQGTPSAMLVGEHRLRYFDIGTLELVGVGAQQWRSRAGYVGLTLYFWDVAGRRWTSWTDARPTIHADVRFNPQLRYQQDAMWDSAPTPAIISRGRFRLSNAQRNRLGRLSGRTACQALLSGPANLDKLGMESARFDDWRKLAEHIAAVNASGLVKGSPLDHLVLVTPAAWGEPVYDQLRQRLIRPVQDASGRVLPLVLPHASEWAFAVDTLQTWNSEQWNTWGILGSAFITSEGLSLTPISLLNQVTLPKPLQSPVLHLNLDAWKAPATPAPEGQTAAPISPTTSEEETDLLELDLEQEEGSEPESTIWANGSAVGHLLHSASQELEQMAERGARASSATTEEALQRVAERLRQVGLSGCASAIAAVAASLASSRHQAQPETEQIARALLRGYYLLHLAREQQAVAETLARFAQTQSM
ncbi:MAG TPA: SWIM zinc finger family protein [Ktedonobacterales bacterium]|nr:SWIM zinc finger family protein [Ktedonobacterales bacterium]